VSVRRIVSGGQTGVDRAALDVAIVRGLPHGGWCPRGRLAEDGPIPAHYQLRETPTSDYTERTEWNVRDSDGTLIVTSGEPTGGTRLTWLVARRTGRPCLVVDVAQPFDAARFAEWIDRHAVRILNVAGPRRSQWEKGYRSALALLGRCLAN
jgi:hypothetical protein